jgi:F-type H+-transporting ATPase subunit alpha
LKSKMVEVGVVKSVKNYILTLEGLPSARLNQLVANRDGQRALVSSLSENQLEVLLLDQATIKPGETFYFQKKGLCLPPAENLKGRVVNPLGQPLDEQRPLTPSDDSLILDEIAEGIETREIIKEQLITCITVVDTLIPIGKGQKEAVFGEPRSGKTAFIQDIISNQKKEGIACIYTAVGRPEIDVKRFVEKLQAAEALAHTIVLAASPQEPMPLIALTPTIAFALANQLRRKGEDVLLVIDDMGTHAKTLREIALLSGRIPGRESYPGDIFYQHAHLIEHGGNYNQKAGGGSLTLLPVMETEMGGLSYLLPTNLIASTDGHLFFSATLYAQGQYPAVAVAKSVTRVGRQAQSKMQKDISDRIRRALADFEEFKTYSAFGAELSEETRTTLKTGELIQEVLKQEPRERIDPTTQILLLHLPFTALAPKLSPEKFRLNRTKIINTLKTAPAFRALAVKLDSLESDEVVSILNQESEVLEKVCLN